jgi:hypothetical protein
MQRVLGNPLHCCHTKLGFRVWFPKTLNPTLVWQQCKDRNRVESCHEADRSTCVGVGRRGGGCPGAGGGGGCQENGLDPSCAKMKWRDDRSRCV